MLDLTEDEIHNGYAYHVPTVYTIRTVPIRTY